MSIRVYKPFATTYTIRLAIQVIDTVNAAGSTTVHEGHLL